MFGMDGDLWLAAILGALLPDFVRIAKGRHGDWPGWLMNPMFWLGLVILVVLAAAAVWITHEYIDPEVEFIPALAIGYAAPDFFSRLVSNQGGAAGAAVGASRLRAWWAN